ncbi:MAG: transposase [Lentimonas sp.]|jgi:transposase
MTLKQFKNKSAEKLLEEFNEKEREIAQLRAQLDYLNRKLYGSGQGESTDQLQTELSDLLTGATSQAPEDQEEEEDLVLVPKPKRKKRAPLVGREDRFAHLPVEDEVELIPPEVQANPDAYERLNSSEETFEVDYTKQHFFRRVIRRPKFILKGKRDLPPVVAPAPVRLSGGIASAHFIALILIAKYWDHLPLTRQVRQYKRYGCEFAIESMVRWVKKAGEWLGPIHEQMRWELLQGDYIQADETPIAFCDPDSGLKRTKKGYLCGISAPGKSVVFDWRTSRNHAAVTQSLEGYVGRLQADAYQPYITFAKDNDDVTLFGCMAHMRRKFTDCVTDGHASRACALILKMIQRLYYNEKLIRESKRPLNAVEIVAYRVKHGGQTWTRLKRLIESQSHKALPKLPMGKACTYALNNWEYLGNYFQHGAVQIDNNLMENCIRPTAVGKKNWLFIGHPNAGQRSAIIYSILISCARLDIDADEYLAEVFAIDTQLLKPEQLRELTPEAFAKRKASGQNLDVK